MKLAFLVNGIAYSDFTSFVIRELRADSLPGRSFVQDLSWNSTNQPSLKKLGLKSGSSLVLQRLDSVPSNVADRSFRLWLKRLSNPENSNKVCSANKEATPIRLNVSIRGMPLCLRHGHLMK